MDDQTPTPPAGRTEALVAWLRDFTPTGCAGARLGGRVTDFMLEELAAALLDPVSGVLPAAPSGESGLKPGPGVREFLEVYAPVTPKGDRGAPSYGTIVAAMERELDDRGCSVLEDWRAEVVDAAATVFAGLAVTPNPEAEKWREHSVTLNRVGYRLAEMLGRPHSQGSDYFEDILEMVDALAAVTPNGEQAARALEDAAEVLARPAVLWRGDSGVTVREDATWQQPAVEITTWLRARAASYRAATTEQGED